MMQHLNRHFPLFGLILACLLGSPLSQAQIPEDAVWIDVRTPPEYTQGHLQQARLIPFDAIEAGVAGLELAADTPIYLYCAVGARAEVARQSLQRRGYSNVTNVGGLEEARKLVGDGPR